MTAADHLVRTGRGRDEYGRSTSRFCSSLSGLTLKKDQSAAKRGGTRATTQWTFLA